MGIDLKSLAVVLAFSGSASAVDVNIDFGTGRTEPPSTYAAAGLAGRWNERQSVGTTALGGFVDLDGDLIEMTLASSSSLVTVTPAAQPFTGDAAKLLGDYVVSSSNNFTLTFGGLPNGQYRVYTYTVGRQDFPRSSTITPNGNAAMAATNTGLWAGSLQAGVTHSVHEVQTVAGGFTLALFSPSDGFINGIQVQSIPEPACGLLVSLAAPFLLRRCRRA